MEPSKATLSPLEIELLLSMTGHVPSDKPYGAWVTACLEGLKSLGFVKQEFEVGRILYISTESGKAKATEIMNAKLI